MINTEKIKKSKSVDKIKNIKDVNKHEKIRHKDDIILIYISI